MNYNWHRPAIERYGEQRRAIVGPWSSGGLQREWQLSGGDLFQAACREPTPMAVKTDECAHQESEEEDVCHCGKI